MSALKRIYLDHAATTPVHPEVIEKISSGLKDTFGNASSTHQRGRSSRRELDLARQVFADSIHARADEIIITSGGSESNNMALIKAAEKMKNHGNHVITSAVEHQAVLKPMAYLESIGLDVTYLPVDKNGLVSLSDLKKHLRDDTILVSIMFVNNEVGSRMPVEEIGQVLAEHQALYHVDAVQAYGKIEVDVLDIGADLLSVSAHKINGPKGIGFLYMNRNHQLPSLISGGNQENKHRAGTENIPYIMGFAEAVEIRLANLKKYQKHLKSLKEHFIKQLEKNQIDFSVNGDPSKTLDHILSVHFHGIESEKFLIQLDLNGIETAAGSACTAGTLQPSHVLTAMYGPNHPAISQTIRFSFGFDQSLDDISYAVNQIAQVIHKLNS